MFNNRSFGPRVIYKLTRYLYSLSPYIWGFSYAVVLARVIITYVAYFLTTSVFPG